VLRREGITIKPLLFDTMIAAYLLDPTGRGYSLDSLSLRYLGRKNISIESLIGKGKSQLTMDLVPLKNVVPYACEDVDVVMRLKPLLEEGLKKEGLENLFNEVEMPLVEVLADMQLWGVSVDAGYLRSLSKEMGEKIEALKVEVYESAGQEFNLDSPRQLSNILYNKLGLPKVRKTKTGQMATDADVLMQLAAYHRLPALLMQYRTLAKFKTTYIDSLPSLILSDGRVHTSLNQTATATGRLSSSEPNLQNIPVRDEWGRRIRRAFIPADPKNWSLLSADYSQIELRFLAHFSADEGLRSAFENGEDIHKFVASRIHKVKPEDVTPEMRRQAKVVNFGIIYGLSAHGLATELSISHHEAQEYIDKYFENHPRVREFLDSVIEKARKDGYVRTIMGRIRYISGIDASDKQTKSLAERLAVNTVCLLYTS
ncbi:MAG: DNA polymerase, partial [Planctomycetota bacterium]|nr:DNA polymerase [Planctomycetota bacterium]